MRRQYGRLCNLACKAPASAVHHLLAEVFQRHLDCPGVCGSALELIDAYRLIDIGGGIDDCCLAHSVNAHTPRWVRNQPPFFKYVRAQWPVLGLVMLNSSGMLRDIMGQFQLGQY